MGTDELDRFPLGSSVGNDVVDDQNAPGERRSNDDTAENRAIIPELSSPTRQRIPPRQTLLCGLPQMERVGENDVSRDVVCMTVRKVNGWIELKLIV